MAQCPLLKTHVSKDKDKKLRKWGGNVPMFVAREIDEEVISELDVSKVSENLCSSLVCNIVEAKENVLSKSTACVDGCSKEYEAHSNLDEIGMDGFCLMAGSTRQEDVL